MVKCCEIWEGIGLGWIAVPWQGEIGKRIYESVSKEAWKLWNRTYRK